MTVNEAYLYTTDDLKRHGCFQAKTYTVQFPTTVPEYLMNHFIRGYIDGDGCIGKSLSLPNVSFIGSNSFILGLNDYIMSVFNIHVTTFQQQKYKGGITNGIINGGKQVRKFLAWVYKDSTIHLERKHIRYLNLVEKYNEFSKVRLCEIAGCENKHMGYGYCQYHYNRLRRPFRNDS